MPREPRETLYALITAFCEDASHVPATRLWNVLDAGGTSAIYEARETYAGMLFRVFCALEPAAPGAPALAILSGDTRPEGRELPESVVKRVRQEARAASRSRGEPPNPRRDDRFETALTRELEDPYFRAGFERKLAKLEATNDLLHSLERARARKQLTKAEVARRINRRPEAVSRLLAGKDQSASLDTITDLAYALGLEIELRIRKRPRRSRNAHSP